MADIAVESLTFNKTIFSWLKTCEVYIESFNYGLICLCIAWGLALVVTKLVY